MRQQSNGIITLTALKDPEELIRDNDNRVEATTGVLS